MLGESVRRRGSPKRRPALERDAAGPRSGVRRLAIVAAAFLLSFVIGYVVAVRLLFPPADIYGEAIDVPSLIGKTVDEAQRELAAAGLGDVEVTRLPHPATTEGRITAQSPLPGQQLQAGDAVQVAVSDGVPHVTVPDVMGFPIERAAALLGRLGFRVQRVEIESDEVAGRVVRQDPRPGTIAALPSQVAVWVSSGPGAVEPDTGRFAWSGRGWTGPPGGSILQFVHGLTPLGMDSAAR